MAAHRPRVALVSTGTAYSGAERCLCVLVEALSGSWEFVALISDRADAELEERLAQAGARVLRIAGLRRTPTIQGTVGLRRTLGRLRPALVHVNATDHRDALGALVVAGSGAVPALATVHLVLPVRARWRERVALTALRRMDRLIAVSQASGDELGGRGVQASVVRNGLAPAALPAARARELLGLDPGTLVIGGVGRLDVQKGWDVLCEAARRVHVQDPDVVFVVVGEGSERARLEGQEACGHVRFVGYRAEASTLTAAFDVLAMPSRYEGLPLVAIDAMHAGVPVVGTPVGGVPELLGDAGTLVGVDDPAALAAALGALVGDPAARRRLGDAARGRATAAFGAQRMADETAAIYADLTAAQARA